MITICKYYIKSRWCV